MRLLRRRTGPLCFTVVLVLLLWAATYGYMVMHDGPRVRQKAKQVRRHGLGWAKRDEWWLKPNDDDSERDGADDHLSSRQKTVFRELRAALRRNNEYNDADNVRPDEFVSVGKKQAGNMGGLQRITGNVTAEAFQAFVTASEPFIIDDGQPCTTVQWNLDVVRQLAGSDTIGVETSKTNRFYSNEGLRKVNLTIGEFLDRFADPKRTMDYYLAEEEIEQLPRLAATVNQPEYTEHLQLDKTQLWIGAGGQVSPLHHDQWENLLCQVQGQRTVLLFDPLQTDKLYPKSGLNRHFSLLDPEHPDYKRFPRFFEARRYEVKLNAGQKLFIPAFWWHQVHHRDDVNIAVNFWFLPVSLLNELLFDLLLPEGPNY